MFDRIELAKRLREAMDGQSPSISSVAIADACGVSPQAVNGWRTDGRIAKKHLPTIARLTGFPISHFIDHSTKAEQNEAAYLTQLEWALVNAYRASLPRWKLALKYMIDVRPERQDEVAEALLMLIAKLAADPVPDSRVEETYGFPPGRQVTTPHK